MVFVKIGSMWVKNKMDDNKKGKRYCCFRSVEWIEKSGVWRITRKKWTMVSSLPQKMKHDLLRKIIPLTTSKEDNVSNVKLYSRVTKKCINNSSCIQFLTVEFKPPYGLSKTIMVDSLLWVKTPFEWWMNAENIMDSWRRKNDKVAQWGSDFFATSRQ